MFLTTILHDVAVGVVAGGLISAIFLTALRFAL